MEKNYGKWDNPEDTEVAFEKVKSGEWTLERFQEWSNHLVVTEVRDEMAHIGY